MATHVSPGGFLALCHAAICGILFASLIFTFFAAKVETRPGPLSAYGLLSAFLLGSTVCSLIYSDALNVETYFLAFSAHSLIVRGAFIAWIYYLLALTNFRIRRPAYFMFAFEFVRTILTVMNLETPHFLEIHDIERIAGPFGDTFTRAQSSPTALHNVVLLSSILHGIYMIIAIRDLRRQSDRRLSTSLEFAFVAVITLIAIDNIKDAFGIEAVYVSEFGLPIVVLALSSSLMDWIGAGQRARVSLVEREAHFDRVLDSISEGVISTDLSLRIKRMNAVAEELLPPSSPPEPLLEESIKLYNPIDGRPATWSSLIDGEDALVIYKGKNRCIFSIAGRTVRSPSNEPFGFVFVFRDITERKREEDMIRRDEKLRALGELSRGVSHDFNNYLAAIRASTDLLERKADDGAIRRRLIQHIKEAVEQASSLTRRLLAFGREEDARSYEELSGNYLIRETAPLIQTLVGNQITLEIVLGATHDRILGDLHELQSALMNLAKNAADAMPNGGTLSLTTMDTRLEGERPALLIEVRDTGSGIEAARIERIFEPYFTTKPPTEGSGFGLPSVHRVISRHGGQIEVQSQLGEGTSFRLILPALATKPSSTKPKQESEENS